MAVEIVTKEDLEILRRQLYNDFKQLLNTEGTVEKNQWLKNDEVRRLLNISANTVQRLRISGKLRSSKVGGIHYYRYADIQQLLNSGL